MGRSGAASLTRAFGLRNPGTRRVAINPTRRLSTGIGSLPGADFYFVPACFHRIVTQSSDSFAKQPICPGMACSRTVDNFNQTGLMPVPRQIVDAPCAKIFPMTLATVDCWSWDHNIWLTL